MLLKEALSPILKRAVKQGRLLAKSKSTFRQVPRWANPEEMVKYALNRDPAVRKYIKSETIAPAKNLQIIREPDEHPDLLDIPILVRDNDTTAPYYLRSYKLTKHKASPHIHQNSKPDSHELGLIDISGDTEYRTPEALGHEIFHPLVSRIIAARGLEGKTPAVDLNSWTKHWKANNDIQAYKNGYDKRILEERLASAGSMRIMKALGAPIAVRKQMLRNLKGALRSYERSKRSDLLGYSVLSRNPELHKAYWDKIDFLAPDTLLKQVDNLLDSAEGRTRILESLYNQQLTGIKPEVISRFLRMMKYRHGIDINKGIAPPRLYIPTLKPRYF